jgi:acyl-coenzyme A synthetase/AMP-(fatty) acid ligase
MSFTELNQAANQIGSALHDLGVQRGDRVGVLAYNTPEVVTAWLGFEKHNLVRAVLHSHFTMDAHVASLNHIEASAMVFDTRFTEQVEAARPQLTTVRHFVAIGPDTPTWAQPFAELQAAGRPDDPYLDVDEDAPCFLQLTSGTTGHPKAWVKTYRSWAAVIDHNLHHLDTFGPGVPPVGADDVNLHFHAIQWASGFQTLYPYLLRGAGSVLLDDESFDPDQLLDAIAEHEATGIFMPGPLLTPVLDAVERRGGFEHRLRRMVIFFGTPDLLERTTKLLGPIWAHGFGSTEQGAVTTRLLPQEAAEAFFPGDWFRPYDVGYLDEGGFLYYTDRAGDKITSPTGTVFPHLIEAALLRHPAVANCGVVGLGQPGSQAVVAAILLKPGHPSTTTLGDEILAQTADLPHHERPTDLVFVTDLPTVLGGAKVQRQALRDQLESRT